MSNDKTWANRQVLDAFHQALIPGTEAKNAEVAGTLLSIRMPVAYTYIGWLLVVIGTLHLLLLTPWVANDWPTWTVLIAMAIYMSIGVYVIVFVRRNRVLYDINGFHLVGLFGKIRSYHWTDVKSAFLLRQGRILKLRTESTGTIELYATMLGFQGLLTILSKHLQIISRERGALPWQWTEKPWNVK